MSTEDLRGREIIIEVGTPDDAAGGRKRRGGVFPPRPPHDYLHRRQTRFINFYDCGQIQIDGAWRDIPLTIDPGYSITFAGPDPLIAFNDFGLSEQADVIDYLLTVPLEDWADTYRKIEGDDAFRYGVFAYQGRGGILATSFLTNHANGLYPENPDWTADGLRPIDSKITVWPTGGLAWTFETYDLTKFKSTTVRDYAAAHVDIDFSKGADIFLIPLFQWTAATQTIGTGAARIKALKMAQWNVKSRELNFDKKLNAWLHGGAEIPVFEGYFAAGTTIGIRSNDVRYMDSFRYIGGEINFEQQLNAWLDNRALTELYVEHGQAASPPHTYGFEPIANFPFNAASGPNRSVEYFNDPTAATIYGGGPATGDLFNGAGCLRAIVYATGKFYYIWSKAAYNLVWPGAAWETEPEP
jgi:hypothetical protein